MSRLQGQGQVAKITKHQASDLLQRIHEEQSQINALINKSTLTNYSIMFPVNDIVMDNIVFVCNKAHMFAMFEALKQLIIASRCQILCASAVLHNISIDNHMRPVNAEMETEDNDELPPSPADSINESGARVRGRLIERRFGDQH